ncbi:TPA: HypC/HybG/HupF family hydrogenase formation chaperone [bacterium]|nr:HypC/HybG/HupF family hydrogenase formation chaperone [bacterium]
MCLAVPAKIISIENDMAQVKICGVKKKASIQLVPEARVGDYILLHAGFAIEVLKEKEALETLEILEKIGEIH